MNFIPALMNFIPAPACPDIYSHIDGNWQCELLNGHAGEHSAVINNARVWWGAKARDAFDQAYMWKEEFATVHGKTIMMTVEVGVPPPSYYGFASRAAVIEKQAKCYLCGKKLDGPRCSQDGFPRVCGCAARYAKKEGSN